MLEIDKVIVLENNEQYLVLDKVANDGIDYYFQIRLWSYARA